MKMIAALALACGVLASGPVLAQKIDVSSIKCEEFLKQDKDFHGQILMWLTGYSMDEDDDPVVNFDSIIEVGKKLGAYCAQNPNAGLLTAYNNAAK